MEFILFIVCVVLFTFLFSRTNALENRLTYMEKYLQGVTEQFRKTGQAETTPTSTAQPEKSIEELEIQKIIEQQTFPASQATLSEPPTESAFSAWLKRDWLMKLGGFFVILGLAWFVNYAFAEGWIGPVGRITLGLTVGAMVLVIGRYRMNSYLSQGSILMFVGALGVIMTVWAAREVYDFFTPVSALFIIFLTSCVLGVTSVHFKRLPLAYANVLLGAVAPLLTASPEHSLTGLFTYLLVLSLGAVWVAVITGWRQLVLVSLVVVFLYSLPYFESGIFGYDENGLLFSFVFSALFFFVSVLGMRQGGTTKIYDLVTAVLTGLFLLAWVLIDADKEWQALLLTAWTLVFALGAFTAVRLGATIDYFFTYAGVGVVLIGAATAVQLDGAVLTIAFILEAALLIVVGYRLTGKASHLGLLVVPSVIPIILSLQSMSPYYWYRRDSVFHAEAFVLYIMIVVALLLAGYFDSMRLNAGERERALLKNAKSIALTLAGVYTTVVIWLVSSTLFSGDSGVMVALFVYTLIALFFYITSRQTGAYWQKFVAGTYFTLVVGRLLLVDVWRMELFFRVVTFMVIGIALIVVAWYARSAVKHNA